MFTDHLILISQYLRSSAVGMGDDMLILQKTIENAQRSDKLILSVMVVSPLFGLNHGEYPNHIRRLVFIRKKCQLIHKNIKFLLIDLVTDQFIFINEGIVTEVPILTSFNTPLFRKILHYVIRFINQNKQSLYLAEFYVPVKKNTYRHINLDDIKHESMVSLYNNFQNYLIDLVTRKKFFPYDVQVELMVDKKNHILFSSPGTRRNYRTIVEWPPPDIIAEWIKDKIVLDEDGNIETVLTFGHSMLKAGFQTQMREYTTLVKLIDDPNWKFIPYDKFPYDRALSFDQMFDIVAGSKYIIGPEGGMCHLARLFDIPFIMVIPNRIYENNNNDQVLRKMFYHWEHDNYYLPPFNIAEKKPYFFLFEKDLGHIRFPSLINYIEKFFLKRSDKKIIFFTVSSNDPQQNIFVKQFCDAYHFEYEKDVQIHQPF